MGSTEAQLKMGFYAQSCPNAEKIDLDFINKHIPNAASLAAAIIRMHFHDCIVRGCDASVLLMNSTSGEDPEKDALPNQTLRGFDFIDRVKSLLEAEYPGIVSCADVLSLLTRNSIGGPNWRVPTGTRDGVISRSSQALANIPFRTTNFTTLQTLFANQGLDLKDLILLSGAHTIGIAHCSTISDCLYNFNGTAGPDPALDSKYVANLKANKCKSVNDNTIKMEMDPGSPKLLFKRRALFESDAALTTNSETWSINNPLLKGSLLHFYAEFADSTEKMGQINVNLAQMARLGSIVLW